MSTQVELAGADRRQAQLVRAELSALRAQISPHFIYNSLTAIASFVRTDPDRARELLLEFADFSRYALRRGSAFTTLAEELRNTERYLVLEQARFGERLVLSFASHLRCLPSRCPTSWSSRSSRTRSGTVWRRLPASARFDHGGRPRDRGRDRRRGQRRGCRARTIRQALAGESSETGRSIGSSNVDSRLRQVYGDAYGLVVETAPNLGTKVSFRVPKFAPGAQQN